MTGLCTYHNFASIGKNEFAGGAFIKDSDIFSLTLIVFHAFTLALVQTPTFLLGPPGMYIDVNL